MARLIDPVVARAVARRVAGDERVSGSYLMERLRRDLDVSVPRSEALVAEISGIPAPEPVRWELIDRATWAENNIASLSAVLRPVADRLGHRLDRLPLPVRLAQRAAISVEVGALLGFVSKRVLGQYDLLVSGRDSDDAVLYFVGVNMVETERRYGFVPEEFALWVAVHEVTHRFQFAGVPWLRERFFTLLERYLDAVQLDARTLARRLGEAVRRVASRQIPPEEKNPAYLLASPEQRAAMDEIQALMAVVEGHGNYVMDEAGARAIPSFRRMRHIFETRRGQTTLLQRALNHVIGIEMKLRQYELGRAFCDRVAAAAGPAALGAVWASEDAFPTLTEVRDPDRWLARVA